MPQNNPPSKPSGRFRLRLPALQQEDRKSIFAEYPYVFFAVAFLAIAMLAKSGGMSLRGALIIAAWIVSIAYFIWQLVRYRRDKSAPAPATKLEVVKKTESTKKPDVPSRPVTKPLTSVEISETKPPKWPAPPPRLVAPLSVTIKKKTQQDSKPQPDKPSKPQTDQTPKR